MFIFKLLQIIAGHFGVLCAYDKAYFPRLFCFQIVITFTSLAKTSHIPSQREWNHFLLLLMLNSGKWPQIFNETSPKSENAGTVREKSRVVDGDQSGSFFSGWTFPVVWLPGCPPLLAGKNGGGLKKSDAVLDLCKTAPRIYIWPDFVGFPLIARNLASILRTLHSHKIQV